MYYIILFIVPNFRGYALSLSYEFLIFRFLIKSSIKCILIVKFQSVIKVWLGGQICHEGARFQTQSTHFTPKPTFPKF